MLDQLTRALTAAAPRGEFSVIPLYNPRRGADARVFFRDLRPARPGSESAEAGEPTAVGEPTAAGELVAAREALAALPEVDAVRAHGGALTVCFADETLAQLGERLEAGETGALDARDLLGGAEVLVNFCDANPTKALHVGHLRNIALGQALAAAFAAAGARVTRQSQVSDYCRSMGEALAGYGELPAHLTPRATGVKSDHFVGDCFQRYAGTPDASQESGTGDPALSAEEAVRHDLAEELLERLSAGDPEVAERWRTLRGWALEGHGATLAALGVTLDREVYESDSRPLTRWILDTGVANGVLTRTDSGAVVYETGDDEYPRLLVARAGRLPHPAPAHVRAVALAAHLARRHALGRVGGRGVARVRALPRGSDAGHLALAGAGAAEQQRDLRDGHRGGRRGEVEQRSAAARGRAAGAAR